MNEKNDQKTDEIVREKNAEILRLQQALAISEAARKSAENVASGMRSSYTYQLGIHVKNAATSFSGLIRFPFAVYRLYKRKKYGISATDKSSKEIKLQNRLIHDFSIKNADVDFILYADISPNVIDGSSIWLSSIAQILGRNGKVLIFFKTPPVNDLITSNIVNADVLYVSGRNFGVDHDTSINESIDIIRKLDNNLPNVKAIFVRGREVSETLLSNKQFYKRSHVYLTDFYTVQEGKTIVSEDQANSIDFITSQAHKLLIQTQEIAEHIKKYSTTGFDSFLLPPPIPTDLPRKDFFEPENEIVKVGYAGKIAPDWGVVELLEWANELYKTGTKIELHIAFNKISSGNLPVSEFKRKINSLLAQPFVKQYGSLNREQAIKLMLSVDFVWCYRPKHFEEFTLELSTKLVEMAASESLCLVYPSKTNINVLGEDYPYYITSVEDFRRVISTKHPYEMGSVREKLLKEHSIESLSEKIRDKITVSRADNSKKIVFASHDFKFIDVFISRLKADGISIKKDEWQWGGSSNEDFCFDSLAWADVIFCEWGLANAVWYSKNNTSQKPLYIRIHAQEVRDKARNFGQQIEVKNVTKFIFVSEYIRNKAIALWNWPVEKTEVIPNMLNTDEFKLFEGRESSSTVNLGMVGIVPQTKRFDKALDLLGKLVDAGVDAHLHLKGPRPEELTFMHAPGRAHEFEYYEQVYKQIEENNLTERVHYYPWGNDVALWYQKVDVILSPSDAESFHYALADGVLSGAYPIVWEREGASKIFPKEWCVKNTEEAFSAIKKIIDSNEGFSRHSELRRSWLVANYGIDIVGKRLKTLMLGK